MMFKPEDQDKPLFPAPPPIELRNLATATREFSATRQSELTKEIVYEADAIFTAQQRQAKRLAEYRGLES